MKVLVANRGEIACRIIRTLRELGLGSVAVYSDADADAPHRDLADEAVAIGEPFSYLDITTMITSAQSCGATALHPGYGFLAENANLARACTKAGITFIGPSATAIDAFGDKAKAREIAQRAAVPMVKGAARCNSHETALKAAMELGFPVLLKAAAGGGGKGMRRVDSAEEIPAAFAAAAREAAAAFGDERLLLESLITPARHIEVQVLGDGRNVVALGERECSLQRRFQKIIEESPATSISNSSRAALFNSATALLEQIGYSGAGTVEFLVGPDGSHFFLEVNTRLQVEHPVTELCLGQDLVAAQIRIAAGDGLPKWAQQPAAPNGHAIEVRLCAEDADAGYLPQTGTIGVLLWPQRPFVRIDAGIVQGQEITPHYDSLLGKIIAWGTNRETARIRLCAALQELVLLGVRTNQERLLELLRSRAFIDGETFTDTVDTNDWALRNPPDYARSAAEQLLGNSSKSDIGSQIRDGGKGPVQTTPWHLSDGFRLGATSQ